MFSQIFFFLYQYGRTNYNIIQQSVCVKSISFFTERVMRSNSAAASVRIEFLSCISVNPCVPFMLRGEPILGLAGEPVVFLFSNELKKFANTPSPPGEFVLILPSIYVKNKREKNFLLSYLSKPVIL